MPINVLGSRSGDKKNIDASSFVQRLYLRTNFIESNNEEEGNMEHDFGNKNQKDLISTRTAASKSNSILYLTIRVQ